MDTFLLLSESMSSMLAWSESMNSMLAELRDSNKNLQELVMAWYNDEYNIESNVNECQGSSIEFSGLQIEENQADLRKNNDTSTFKSGDCGELMGEGFAEKWSFVIKTEYMNFSQSNRSWRRKLLREGAIYCFDCLCFMEQDLANRVWSRKKKKKREEQRKGRITGE